MRLYSTIRNIHKCVLLDWEPHYLALWFCLKKCVSDATNPVKDSFDTPCVYHLSERRHTVGILSLPVTAFDDGATRF